MRTKEQDEEKIIPTVGWPGSMVSRSVGRLREPKEEAIGEAPTFLITALTTNIDTLYSRNVYLFSETVYVSGQQE